jgi:hypothetical protein
MLSTRIRGVSPFKGYRVTCFTNEEKEAAGVASKATWLLETELKEKVGVDFSRGEIWEPYMVEDRNLVTGQNPHSAAVLGARLLEGARGTRRVGTAAGPCGALERPAGDGVSRQIADSPICTQGGNRRLR